MVRLFIDIYYVWKAELKVMFRDKAVILLFFIVPAFYPLVYTSFYNNEVVRDVNTIVVDESNSMLSREFIRKVDATPDVRIIGKAADLEEAKEYTRNGKAFAILLIPRDFSKNLNTGKQSRVFAFCDIRSMLLYKTVTLAATEVSLDMGASIRVEDVGHATQKQDDATMQTIESKWVPFYNPQNGYAGFLIPAVLIMIIQQTMFLGIGTLVGTHNDRKTYTVASHAYFGKNVNAVRLTLGKGLAYSFIYLFVSIWILRVAPYLFNLPQVGSPETLAVFLMPFLLAATFFSMTISYFVSQREFTLLLFAFSSVVFLFLSGISWPWTSMPPALQALGNLIPSTPAIHGFVKINTLGANFNEVWPEYVQLWIQVGVYFILAVLMYHWWIRNYDPKYQGKMPKKAKG